MSYDNTSFYGDVLFDEYVDKCNFINPPTSTGFYVYHIVGDGFDSMSDMCTQFLNDYSILSANSSSLDPFWGVSYNMPRPSLYIGTENERLLTDEEYKIYLYLRNCRLMTKEDLEICLGNCFNIEDYSIKFSEEMHYLSTTNHLNYTPTITDTSNIQKNSDDDTYDYVIKQNSDDEEVNVIGGNLSETTETITVIEIPFNNWDNEFLSLIQQYISIKNNLEIKEYSL